MADLYIKGFVRTYEYYFTAFNGPSDLKAEGGNYAFLRLNPDGSWFVAYVGECQSFRTRLPGHERRAESNGVAIE